jgi:periplasmic protein TonB
VQPEVVPEASPPDPAPPVASTGAVDADAPPGTGSPDGVAGAPPGGTGSGPGSGVPDGTGDTPIHIDARITPPVAIHRVQPRYTEQARVRRVQGVVVVEAIIDRAGRVTDVRILKGLPAGLDEASMAAVRQWRFRPAVLADRPVAVYFRLTVRFEMQ